MNNTAMKLFYHWADENDAAPLFNEEDREDEDMYVDEEQADERRQMGINT